MLKKNNVLFSAFQFLSLDYEYEFFKKQKLATSLMLIPFPQEILHKEEYYHSNIFVNDVYRKPWKRSIPLCRVNEEDSVTEVWRRYVLFGDFLEKQPTPSNREKSIDIVPSSNPYSQVDLEEVCLVPELNVPEEKSTHEESWRTILSATLEDYLLPKEIVFIDHLAQFGQRLPRLRSLLSRLKTFPVQDPLETWQRNIPAKELLFRMNTSRKIEEYLEPEQFLEEFHKLPPSTEKHDLFLPCILELPCSSQSRCQLSELNTTLQLVPEDISEENGKTNIKGLSTKLNAEDVFIEQTTSHRKLDTCKEETMEKAVCFRPGCAYKMEVPISPPYLKPQDTNSRSCNNLEENPLSPDSTIFQITDANNDIFESLESHSDVKTLRLPVPIIQEETEQLVVKELKEKLTISPDTATVFTVNENERKLGLNIEDHNNIENFKINISSTEELNQNGIESFKKISDNRERILEEVSLINQKTSIPKYIKQFSCYDSYLSEKDISSTQSNVFSTNTNADRKTEAIKVITHGERIDQSKAFLPLLKDNMAKQYLTPSKEISSASQANIRQQQSCQSFKSMGEGLSGHNPQEKDWDLLSSFIAVRSRNSLGHSVCKHQENVLPQDYIEQKRRITKMENIMLCKFTSKAVPDNFPKHQTLIVHVAPSASQCDAHHILQNFAEPVIKKLICLEVIACMEWSFTSVFFDCTRFLLREQEKIISSIGKRSDKDVMIFQHAALLHILVTLRDLNLMCSLDPTLEYLCKAKQKYESVLGPCLDPLWRKLRIIQFARDKAKETNPKITALLKWLEKAAMEYEHLKVLILTQMDSKVIEETLNNICKTKGLRAIGLCPASGNTFLKTTDVLDRLTSCFCLISNNHFIASDFPWTHFSLVIEYDCTDYWLQLCQNIHVSHMTFKISVPNNLNNPKHHNHHCKHVPYVLLSSEELINNAELLHILESRYNMTFIERPCNASLHLLGKKSHFAIITVDVSTVVIIQHLEELMHDKSAENLILKLVALSLQYSFCWVLLYDKSNQSGYSLSGEILHGVSLIYSAIIPFTSKSEDVDIKVLISSGIDETASLIHQIVEKTLMLSKCDPYKWLDRSWISVQISEEEKVLLSFPCNNPMAAQLLLSRGSSLQWLLSANLEQLKQLFPEVPSKVLKMFTDTTTLHHLRLSTSTQRPSQTASTMKCTATMQGVSTKDQVPCICTKMMHQSDVSLNEASSTKCHDQSNPSPFQKRKLTDNISQQPVASAIHTFATFTETLRQWTWTESGSEQHLNQSARLQGNIYHSSFFSSEHSSFNEVSHHTNSGHRSNEQEPRFSINQKSFYADLLHEQSSTNTSYCRREFQDAMTQSLASVNQKELFKQTQETGVQVFSASSKRTTKDSHSEIFKKRRLTLSSVMVTEDKPAVRTVTQLSQEKKRKLSYEKVPGRCDGQTRLKFF
ncbi:protein shortage in chiasmata 1 ortholog [Engystomops pustulosus]|uniref:protein shortage in chiasmata 1 ortholog n=1 Tax=Engystomops pustulosus TaxID=76066 RepID=UPI003AFB6D82